MPTMTGIRAEGLDLLQTPEFAQQMTRYLDRVLSIGDMRRLMQGIVDYYSDHDRPVVRVSLPEQEVANGVLQILVLEATVGEIKLEGNERFADRIFFGAFGTEPGQHIRKSAVDADIDWINRNPFRTAAAVFSPGKGVGTTDITINVHEQPTMRPYVGYEDSGNELTGDHRLLAGFNWGNAFGLDHQFSYQFSVNPEDYDLFSAHSATYVAPLPWRHILTVFGSYSETGADLDDPLDLHGKSWQTSLRYDIPLPTCHDLRHDVTFGFDFKRSNNNLEFGGAEVFDRETDVNQWSVSYSASLPDKWGETGVGASVFFSPDGMTSHADQEDYDGARDGADPTYVYGRFNLGRTTRLPWDFTWILRGDVQVSDDNLLGSEQFGVGGAHSVRGYEEREANGDGGWALTNELRAPAIFPWSERRDRSIQFLTFWDYGEVENRHDLHEEEDDIHLSGVGLGVHITIFPYVTAGYDYAWQLHDSGLTDEDDSRGHASVLVAFPF